MPYFFLYLQHLSECLTSNRLLLKVHLIKFAVRKQEYEIIMPYGYGIIISGLYTKIPSHPSKCSFELQA